MSIQGDVAAAYDDVRNDKTDTTWILLSYSDEKSDNIGIVSTGEIDACMY